MRLLHAEDFGYLDLPHAAVFEDRIDFEGELRVAHVLLLIVQAEVCKDVSAAFGYAGNAFACFSCLVFQSSFAFLYSPARLPLAAVLLARSPSPAWQYLSWISSETRAKRKWHPENAPCKLP